MKRFLITALFFAVAPLCVLAEVIDEAGVLTADEVASLSTLTIGGRPISFVVSRSSEAPRDVAFRKASANGGFAAVVNHSSRKWFIAGVGVSSEQGSRIAALGAERFAPLAKEHRYAEAFREVPEWLPLALQSGSSVANGSAMRHYGIPVMFLCLVAAAAAAIVVTNSIIRTDERRNLKVLPHPGDMIEEHAMAPLSYRKPRPGEILAAREEVERRLRSPDTPAKVRTVLARFASDTGAYRDPAQFFLLAYVLHHNDTFPERRGVDKARPQADGAVFVPAADAGCSACSDGGACGGGGGDC